MSYAQIEKWEARKTYKFFQARAALGLEGVIFEAWSDARQNHVFNNRTGMLEASIRVEKKKLSNGWTAYRLAAGVGGVSVLSGGWLPYQQGMPGGVRASTVKGLTYDPNAPYYAPFVELGTRNMAARPFLLPPVLARKRDFDRVMAMARNASIFGGI